MREAIAHRQRSNKMAALFLTILLSLSLLLGPLAVAADEDSLPPPSSDNPNTGIEDDGGAGNTGEVKLEPVLMQAPNTTDWSIEVKLAEGATDGGDFAAKATTVKSAVEGYCNTDERLNELKNASSQDLRKVPLRQAAHPLKDALKMQRYDIVAKQVDEDSKTIILFYSPIQALAAQYRLPSVENAQMSVVAYDWANPHIDKQDAKWMLYQPQPASPGYYVGTEVVLPMAATWQTYRELSAVLNGEFGDTITKIKSYASQFAEIFPDLQNALNSVDSLTDLVRIEGTISLDILVDEDLAWDRLPTPADIDAAFLAADPSSYYPKLFKCTGVALTNSVSGGQPDPYNHSEKRKFTLTWQVLNSMPDMPEGAAVSGLAIDQLAENYGGTLGDLKAQIPASFFYLPQERYDNYFNRVEENASDGKLTLELGNFSTDLQLYIPQIAQNGASLSKIFGSQLGDTIDAGISLFVGQVDARQLYVYQENYFGRGMVDWIVDYPAKPLAQAIATSPQLQGDALSYYIPMISVHIGSSPSSDVIYLEQGEEKGIPEIYIPVYPKVDSVQPTVPILEPTRTNPTLIQQIQELPATGAVGPKFPGATGDFNTDSQSEDIPDKDTANNTDNDELGVGNDPAQSPIDLDANPDSDGTPAPNPAEEPKVDDNPTEDGDVPTEENNIQTPEDADKVTIPEEKLENEESEDSELQYFSTYSKPLEDADPEIEELEISEEDDHSDNVQGNPAYDVSAIASFEALKAAIGAEEESLTLAADITFNEQLTITKDLTINGANHSLKAGTPLESMFITAGPSLTLTNLTMDGGGQSRHIKAFDANLTLTDVTLTNGSSANDSENSEGGSIWLTGKNSQPQVTLTNVTLDANQTVKNSPNPLTRGHGGAIYSYYANVFLINCTVSNNHSCKDAEGGAIFFEGGSGSELSISGDQTQFSGNHCFETNIPANQGGAIYFGQDRIQDKGQPTCTISGGHYTSGTPFNTGGILRSWKGVVTISGADFIVPTDAGDAYGISGGSICAEGTNLTIDKCTFTNTGNGKVTHAGGLIDIVGSGSTSNITNCTFTGRGQANDKSSATFGGAICYETDTNGSHTIVNCEFKDFSSDNTGGAIAIGTKKGEGGSANVTIKGTTIENTQTLFWGDQVGGAIYVGPGNALILDGATINNAKAGLGGLIYNLGSTTITGDSKLSDGYVHQKVGAGIYNAGYLKLDAMTLNGNNKGDLSTNPNHPDKKPIEYPGLNVYAAEDVIITPHAKLDAGDVRVLDGQSAILLTGNLDKQINVSISETLSTKPAEKQLAPETASRKLGYVVAKGSEGYTPSLTDAQSLHYLTKNPNAPNQLAAEPGDHLSPGKWDFVLDPANQQVVLGQRAKMTYHGNGTDDAQVTFAGQTETDPTRDQLYYFYAADAKPYILEGGGILQLSSETLPEKNYPQRQKYNFRGWYQEASTNNLYDFTTSSPFGRAETSIFAYPDVHVYAGWEALQEKTLKKVWGDGVKEEEKVPVTLTLSGSYEDPYTPLDTLADGTTEAAPSPAPFLAKADGTFVDGDFSETLSRDPWATQLLAAKQVYRYDKENKLKTIDVQYNLGESPVPEGMTVTYNEDFESGFVATNDKSYKVTYRVDGTSPRSFTPGVPDEKIYASKSTVNVEANLTTDSTEHEGKQGNWIFNGWQIESPKGLAQENGQFTMPQEDVVLVGTWRFTPNPKVTYRVEGISPSPSTPVPAEKDYASGSSVNVEANLTTTSTEHEGKQGTWTFSGWRIQSPDGLALQSGQFTMPNENVELVGSWAFQPSPKPDPKPEPKPDPKPEPQPQPTVSQTIPEVVIPHRGSTQEVKIGGNTVIIRQTQPTVQLPATQAQSLPRTGQSNSFGWSLGLGLAGLALAIAKKKFS